MALENTGLAELRGDKADDSAQPSGIAAATPVPAPTPTVANPFTPVADTTVQEKPTTYRRTVTVIEGGVEHEVTYTLPLPQGESVDTTDRASRPTADINPDLCFRFATNSFHPSSTIMMNQTKNTDTARGNLRRKRGGFLLAAAAAVVVLATTGGVRGDDASGPTTQPAAMQPAISAKGLSADGTLHLTAGKSTLVTLSQIPKAVDSGNAGDHCRQSGEEPA